MTTLRLRIDKACKLLPSNTRVVGIDPGMNGGMAIFTREGVAAMPMPKDSEDDVFSMLEALNDGHDTLVGIEDVPKWCGGQRFAQKNIYGASMAVLFGNFKLCQGICMGLGFNVKKILPMTWQREVGARTAGMTSSNPQWKNHLKAVAQSACDLKVTLAISDAILIGAARLLQPR